MLPNVVVFVLLCIHSRFAVVLKRKRKLVALLLFYRSIVAMYKCSEALPQGAVGWSAVCDCGIS